MVLGLKRSAGKPEPTKPKTEWPAVNELVWVRLPCCESAIHPSRVEGTENGDLVIAAPWKPHPDPLAPPEDGRAFQVGWKQGTSTKQLKVSFVSVANIDVPAWVVGARSDIDTVQRRRYVRGNCDVPVRLVLPMSDVDGRILDISEGGLRIAIPATDEPRRDYLKVVLEFEGKEMMFDVEVAWWSLPSGETNQVGLEFVDLEKSLRDRLRKHAYALQMDERSR